MNSSNPVICVRLYQGSTVSYSPEKQQKQIVEAAESGRESGSPLLRLFLREEQDQKSQINGKGGKTAKLSGGNIE